MPQKVCHVVDCINTFRHFRFKNAESVCQFSVSWKIQQMVRSILFSECFGKIQCIMLEHIILAGNQIAWRQVFRNRRMFRISIAVSYTHLMVFIYYCIISNALHCPLIPKIFYKLLALYFYVCYFHRLFILDV